MTIPINRGDFDAERGRFPYFISFRKDGVDDDDIRLRVPVEVSMSVSENGDLADMSFEVPKACRTQNVLALVKGQPEVQAIESRVFISVPGLNGDAVLSSAAELQFDAAGRIIGVAIHPF
jgi:hypothetical protein